MRLFWVPFISLLSGCMTSITWDQKGDYYEEVMGFYLVEHKNEVIASGGQYSYLFNLEAKTKTIFKLSRTIEFSLLFNHFQLSTDNHIFGEITLYVNLEKLTLKQKAKLKSLGFKMAREKNTLQYKQTLYGTRYLKIDTPKATRFKEPYYVIVGVDDSATDVAQKVMLTPVALAVDMLVIYPVSFILLIATAN